MNKFIDLYNFIDIAKTNRKYPENTANGLKSALKVFEKELNLDELNSIDMIEDNVEEIFINTVDKNKEKNIGSLNTYKARLLKVIKDYQKYGINPSKMQGWTIKSHKLPVHRLPKLDKSDKDTDTIQTGLSNDTNTPVHKIELSLHTGKAILFIPKDINAKEIKIIKNILDSLTIE